MLAESRARWGVLARPGSSTTVGAAGCLWVSGRNIGLFWLVGLPIKGSVITHGIGTADHKKTHDDVQTSQFDAASQGINTPQ